MYRKLRSGRIVITKQGWTVIHYGLFAIMVWTAILVINGLWAMEVSRVCH